ncbi:MAG: NAD+ synthase [Balneolaceae bacterium]
MKVRIEQMNPVIGRIDGNVELILEVVARAESDGIDLLILPELVVCGYPPQDLLEKESFREYCYRANEKIIDATGTTALLFGTITSNPARLGRKMFNSAILARGGKKLDQVNKTLLPTYDIFDDLRYFEPNRRFDCMVLDGVKLGVTICEDIWYNENEVQYHHYDVNPAEELKELGAQVIINISASPYTKSKHEHRLEMLRSHAKRFGLPLFYCNQTGAQTEVIFDGDSCLLSNRGDLVAMAEPFEPGTVDLEWEPDSGRVKAAQTVVLPAAGRHARILGAIRLGLRDYLAKTGISEKVLLGLSGGIDSALTAVLAVEALGPGQVTAVTMPSSFSSSGSVNHSQILAEELGIEFHEIAIQPLFEEYQQALEPLFHGTGFGVAEENLQSRIRGGLLMAISNKFGHMLLSTGNKSEVAVGYATLYGDMNGGLNLIGDLYKTEVYTLSRWLNEEWYGREVIPNAILEKAPSAELRPDQKDSDSLPDYEVLDKILFRYIDCQQEKREIIEAGYVPETVQKVIRLVDNNEFKRYQAPPILKLSPKSFGAGRRWPLVQGWTGHETG